MTETQETLIELVRFASFTPYIDAFSGKVVANPSTHNFVCAHINKLTQAANSWTWDWTKLTPLADNWDWIEEHKEYVCSRPWTTVATALESMALTYLLPWDWSMD